VERSIRIVLADDHPVVRIGVKNMLSLKDGFDVIGEASDGDEAITQTLELEPDILLLDVQMPRLPGIEAMRAIMSGTPTVKILLLTSTISTQQIIEALHIGARGIVLKDALASHLQTAIRTVYTGDYWIGGKRVVNLVSALHDLMQQATVPQRKQPRHRQAIHPERRNGQAASVKHLRQDRRFHAPGTGAVCDSTPPGGADVGAPPAATGERNLQSSVQCPA
jgi:DNA-binding NarL/FixJ family response regulator